MKIIVFHDTAGIIDPECSNAFRKLGHTVKNITLERDPDNPDKTLPYNIVERVSEILTFMPDLLLMINGSGIDDMGLIPRVATILKIPLALWYVDRPYTLENWNPDNISPTTVIFTADRLYVNEIRTLGFDRVFFLPLATNPERFNSDGRIHSDKPMDLVFVGKLDRARAEACLNALKCSWHERPADIDAIFQKILHVYSKRQDLSLAEISATIASEHGVALDLPSDFMKKLFYNSLDYMANVHHRSELVRSLRSFGITVYGGWEWLDVVDRGHHMGEVDSFNDLAAIYKSAAINLNISRLHLRRGINQKLFDVPAAGGFLLTDHREDVEEFFVRGREVVCYESLDDLKRHIRYYLARPDERENIVQAAREKVINGHTYEARMSQLVRHINNCLSDSEYSAEINRAIRKDYLYIETLNLLGTAAYETGQSGLALEFFKLGLSLYPYNTNAKKGIETISRVINHNKAVYNNTT